MNKIIKILVGADFLFQFGYGLLTPVFAIFIVRSIENGTAQVAGTAVAIYWIVKSILRVPLAWYLDKKRGEYDDFCFLILGFFLTSILIFFYYFAKTPFHIYTIQFFMGIAGAFGFTPWYGFFSRHIDKFHENFEWSITVSLSGIAIGVAGFVAGVMADKIGFSSIFILGGILSLFSTATLFFIGKNIQIQKKDSFQIKEK